MEEQMVRHHLDVFLNHFKPETPMNKGLVTCGLLYNVPFVTDIEPVQSDGEFVNRLWTIRDISKDVDEITLSAGIHSDDAALGYVISRFPHFGCPIHFRVMGIRNQITEQGARRSFTRIIRRMRFWMIHTLDPETSKDYQNQLDRQLAEMRQP